MQPPICDVCDERFDPADGGRRVGFVATDAGHRFAERVEREGIVGDSPDEGWFCGEHLEAARRLSPTHTRPTAIRELRGLDAPGQPGEREAPEPAAEPAAEPGPATGAIAAARERLDRRRQTRVDHPIPPTPRDDVAAAMRRTLDAVLGRLGLADLEPVTRRETSTSPSPEWRDSATTTTIETRETWTSDDHEVGFRSRDTRWDGWSGAPRRGDLFQGTISLTIDDTWLFASFGSEGVVTSLDESGHRTEAITHLLDELIDGFTDRTARS